jgi:hypothetical protein
MPRLGQLLVAARLLDASQIERGLRAQVVWGGRLGTNLIELGMLDLEGLSRALGRQHGMPVALARHFERADHELQQRLSTALAKQWSVVPLLHVGESKEQIAVAALDPLPRAARGALAEELVCAPEAIVVSVAAEMRVRYHLERVYGIARPPRFLRSRNRPSSTPFPQFDNVPVPIDSDAEVAVPIAVDDSAHPTGRERSSEAAPPQTTAVPPAAEQAPPPTTTSPAALSATVPALPVVSPADDLVDIERLIDEAIAQVTTSDAQEPAGRDRRTYLRTVDETDRDFPPLARRPAEVTPARDTLAAKTSAATKAPDAGPAVADPPDHEPATQPLARLAIKRVAAPPLDEPGGAAVATFLDATRAIRRATNRDRVAERVIEALERFVVVADAAVLLYVRGAVAISWASFSRTAAPAGDIVVPLDQPGLLARVVEKNAIARGSAGELGPIDAALLRSLGDLRGDLVIVPIAVADAVMGMIATATEADAPVEAVESIAGAAAAALARLIRDASR